MGMLGSRAGGNEKTRCVRVLKAVRELHSELFQLWTMETSIVG